MLPLCFVSILFRDTVESGVVRIYYVKSGEHQADVLTKALDVNSFETHARFLLNARAGSTTVYGDVA